MLESLLNCERASRVHDLNLIFEDSSELGKQLIQNGGITLKITLVVPPEASGWQT